MIDNDSFDTQKKWGVFANDIGYSNSLQIKHIIPIQKKFKITIICYAN